MRTGGTRLHLRACLVAALLAAVAACEGFREFPAERDATTDHGDARSDGDVSAPRDAADANDAADASDVSDASDVTPAPTDAGPCGGACPSGQVCCDNRCVDPMTDPTNCGGCAVTCAAANASSTCQRGACVNLCLPGFGDCDTSPLNGCEVNLSSSAFNCGACARACRMFRENSTCDTGRCAVACTPGWGNCDGDVDNGCEVNLQTSIEHCAGCDNPCRANHNAPYCDGVMCQLGACDPGWADCNGDRRDGCETHTDTDVGNCGRCNNACAPGAGATPTCSSGVCATVMVTCTAPRAECDGVVTPMAAQCETDITASAAHCGRCGNACSAVNATSRCEARACQLTCNAGFGNCDSNAANGCETNLNTSPDNCGACRQACALPNAVGVACVMSACRPTTCAAGYGDCDANPANGCETDTRTAVTHCGACGRAWAVANGTPRCMGSLCAVATCNGGFGNCDGNAANGCEVNNQIDPRHCGACGTLCNLPNSLPTCSGGRCVLGACFGSYQDCDRNPATGCESDILRDTRNCGGCNRACPFRCVNGACIP